MGIIRGKKRNILTFASGVNNNTCPNCLDRGIIVYDNHNGDEICSNCGQILQEKIISEEQEWRSFANNDGNSGVDRRRVGAVNDAWFDNIGGTTMMGGDKKYRKLVVVQDFTTNTNTNDRKLRIAFMHLKTASEYINLKSSIIERCREIIKELQDNENSKLKISMTTILGCICYAAKEEREPVNIKLLNTVDLSINERDIIRAAQNIHKMLLQTPMHKTFTTYASRELCNKVTVSLNLSEDIRILAGTICVKYESNNNFEVTKPHFIASAAIFLACQLLNGHIEIIQLLQILHCGMSSFTSTYKILKDQVKDLINPTFIPQNIGGLNGLIHADNLHKIKFI